MRFLALHVDYFNCKITERGRSPLVEEFTDPETTVENALVVLASVEKADEPSLGAVAEGAAEEIAKLADNVKAEAIVLHPFAHLFGELSSPKAAVQILRMVEERLRGKGLQVTRTPFGWFNTLEIKAKGHPLSRVARIITAEEAS